jgi:ubiquinone/menaquinone biosynthesis C-methylase UbiE
VYASITIGPVFEELKTRMSAVWSSAPWEEVAPQLAPIHEHLVRALQPAPGVRWLDVGTGTGAVAILAARAGADVTGIDLAPGLIETARKLAAEQGLEIRFETGDAEALPVEDASFDVVSSSMGLIFAPDHAAVARELARVTKSGGRLGFSAWTPDSGFFPVTRKYSPPMLPGQGDSDDWASRAYVEPMLGDAFELEFEEGNATFRGESGEAMWQLLVRSAGPMKARSESLGPEELERFHREFVEFLEAHRTNGGISLPSTYVVVLGTRR